MTESEDEALRAAMDRLRATYKAYNAGDAYGKVFVPGLSRAVEVVQQVMLERREAREDEAAPAEETEYAVRAEHGVIIPRPSLEYAQNTVTALEMRGGTAVLLSRTVVRSEWTEVDAERAVLAAEFGVRPDQVTLRGCDRSGEEWT